MTWPPRLLGALTAAYGAAVIARPGLLTRPCGLADAEGNTTPGLTVLARAIGARDLISGVAVAAAPDRRSLRTALAVRVGADFADAIGFGLGLPDRDAARKAAIVAGTWGLVCAASGFAVAGRDPAARSVGRSGPG